VNDHLADYARSVVEHLRSLKVEFAMVGGIAVSIRTLERFTKDIDIAISVESDSAAELLVNSFKGAGFLIAYYLEKEEDGTLMTVRLTTGGEVELFIDLLFATSGIESEVVANSMDTEVFPGFVDRVATIPSLLAMKVLSADWKIRPQDIFDIQNLLSEASPEQIAESRKLLNLITERGYNRDKDLQADLDKYIAQFNS
jgi:hypothetical protein